MEKEKYLSRVTLEIHSGPNRRGTWGRKQEEFVADFLAVAKRTLTEEEFRVFRFRYLLAADWKLCCAKLKIERGPFHHMIYRIQTKLGETFASLEPYASYPLDEYFGGTHRSNPVTPFPVPEARVIPIRPPVSKPVWVDDQRKAA
jgi:hypothetical protein